MSADEMQRVARLQHECEDLRRIADAHAEEARRVFDCKRPAVLDPSLSPWLLGWMKELRTKAQETDQVFIARVSAAAALENISRMEAAVSQYREAALSILGEYQLFLEEIRKLTHKGERYVQ